MSQGIEHDIVLRMISRDLRTCDQCQEIFDTSKRRERHEREVHGRRYPLHMLQRDELVRVGLDHGIICARQMRKPELLDQLMAMREHASEMWPVFPRSPEQWERTKREGRLK